MPVADTTPSSESPEEWEAAKRGEMNRCPTLQKHKKGPVLEAAEPDVCLDKNVKSREPREKEAGADGP